MAASMASASPGVPAVEEASSAFAAVVTVAPLPALVPTAIALVPAPVTRVPEPGIYAMVFAGLAVVVWKVRRSRRR
jgi:hypothetical protein